MKCPRCAAETPFDSVFCVKCGAQLREANFTQEQSRDDDQSTPPVADRIAPSGAARRARTNDESEQDLWVGTYSPKAMANAWAALAVLTIGGLILGVLALHTVMQWALLTGIIAVAGLSAGLVFVYRRFGVKYRLTSQRLFHEKGLFDRTINRIEVVKIDDISCQQRVWERMLGIGSIMIRSTDQTDPDFWIRGIEHARQVSTQIDNARRAEQIRRGVIIMPINQRGDRNSLGG